MTINLKQDGNEKDSAMQPFFSKTGVVSYRNASSCPDLCPTDTFIHLSAQGIAILIQCSETGHGKNEK